MQKIDFPLDAPRPIKLAADGKNMAGQRFSDPFLPDDLRNQDSSSFATSGKTLFVGYALANDSSGDVLVYEQISLSFGIQRRIPLFMLPAHPMMGLEGVLALMET